MNNDLISIIVPVYNIDKFIEQCIISILKQTYRNLEIILVNDGSTDYSTEICNTYAKLDKRIIVLNKENGGLSDARNVGLKIAKGNFIGFVDGDDWIEPMMYQYLYDAIIQYDADVAFGITKRVTRQHFDNSVTKENVLLEGKEILDAFICPEHQPHILRAVWDKLYRREIIGELQFLLDKHGEDGPFNTVIMSRAKKCVFVPHIVYNYRDFRPGSISSNDRISDRLFSDRLPLMLEQIKVLREVGRIDLASRQEHIYLNEVLNYYCQIGNNNSKQKYRTNIENVLKKSDALMFNVLFRRKLYYKIRIKILLYKLSPKLLLFFQRK